MKYSRLLTGLLAGLLVLTASALPLHAEDLDEMRRAHEETLRQIQETQQALESNKKTVSNLLYRYNALNAKVKASEKYLSALQAAYDKTARELKALNSQYAQAEAQLQKCKDDYALMVRQMYLHLKDRDRLTFIFSSDNFAQSLRRVRYLGDFARHEERKAKEIQERQAELDTLRRELSVKKDAQAALVREQQGERDRLKKERSAQDNMVKQMRRQSSKLTAELKKQQQKAARLNATIERIIAEEARKSNSEAAGGAPREAVSKGGYAMTVDERKLSDEFGQNKGRLPFPVNRQGNIVVHFGQDKHSNMKYVQNTSNGIDIVTAKGASARAVFKGTVSKVFTLQGSNCTVIIRHGNYLTIYSNLVDVKVSSGQTVVTGQELGTIYTDRSQADQTLLQFQVWLEKQKLDPELWLKRN